MPIDQQVENNDMQKLTEEAIKPSNESEQRVSKALEIHGRPAVPAIFNRKERQVVQDALISELEQGVEYRHKAIGMAMESRLHSIREACNHVSVMGKTHLREQRIEFFGQVMRRLEKRMYALSEDFLEDADRRFAKLDRYSNDMIKAREKARIEKSVGQFLNTLDAMMDEFNSIVAERIDHTPTVVTDTTPNTPPESR